MKPFAFAEASEPGAAVEAAPARRRIRVLAIAMFVVLALLAGRSVQLAFAGDPTARQAHAAAPELARADLVDRNGVLLATTVRAFTMTAQPALVWSPRETASALRRVFPDLDAAATERRLADRSRDLVYLKRGLSARERAQVMDLGLGGIGFETEERRYYPNGALGGQALGYTDRDLNALAGVERGLDAAIRRGGDAPVRLALDVRVQYAAETELDAAARAAHATGGAAIVLDGRTGEALALASWPALDPNNPGAATPEQRRNRFAGERYEMGSTLKPFTVAMALDLGLARSDEVFDLAAPYAVDGVAVRDFEPVPAPATLRAIIAHSSNKGAAQIALRVGAARQRSYLDRLGLLRASSLQLEENAAPITHPAQSRLDVATLGFGYGLALSPAALSGAYTVFANQGAYVAPTLRALGPGETPRRTRVFSAATTSIVLGFLRATVREGTARAADVPGLGLAGKTGTADKLGDDLRYDRARMVSSFAAIFPAEDPRYVIVLALDEPERTAANGGVATGGAVAAGPVGRIARRIAPLLGLHVAASAQ